VIDLSSDGGEKKLIRCPSCGFEAEGAEFDMETTKRFTLELAGVKLKVADDLYICRCGHRFFLSDTREDTLNELISGIVDLLNKYNLDFVETVLLLKSIQLILLDGLNKYMAKVVSDRIKDKLRQNQIER
jgi:hypothetical protein